MSNDVYDDMQNSSVSWYKKYLGSQKEIQELKTQLAKAVEVIDGLSEDIETPYRLGLSEKPNENWTSLNTARQFLAEIKEMKTKKNKTPPKEGELRFKHIKVEFEKRDKILGEMFKGKLR